MTEYLLGRTQATPLTAWLRIPLDWFSSATVAQFPDESHTSIRRIFTPNQQPHSKRIFCGYCGTHLSYWTEHPTAESEYLNVTLGSLLGDDIRALKELDLLSEDIAPEDVGAMDGAQQELSNTNQLHEADSTNRASGQRRWQDSLSETGAPDWFEEMIAGSQLGNTRRYRRGIGSNSDGSMTVQWEISEFQEGDSEPATPTGSSKRKIADVSNDDTTMRG